MRDRHDDRGAARVVVGPREDHAHVAPAVIQVRPDDDAFVLQLRIRSLDAARDVVADAAGKVSRSHAIAHPRSQREGRRPLAPGEIVLDLRAREMHLREQRIRGALCDHGGHEGVDPVPVRVGVAPVVDIDEPERALRLRGVHAGAVLIVLLEGQIILVGRAAEAEDKFSRGVDPRVVVVPETGRADSPPREHEPRGRVAARREKKRHEVVAGLELQLPERSARRGALRAKEKRHLGRIDDRIRRLKGLEVSLVRAGGREPPFLELRGRPVRRPGVPRVPGEAPRELARGDLLADVVGFHRQDRLRSRHRVLAHVGAPERGGARENQKGKEHGE